MNFTKKIFEIILGISIILFFSFLGNFLSRYIPISIPGSVIGMILLFLSLTFNIIKSSQIEKVSNFLIGNLALFFVPAGVGIIDKYAEIKNDLISILLIIFLTTILAMVICAKIIDYLIKRKEK